MMQLMERSNKDTNKSWQKTAVIIAAVLLFFWRGYYWLMYLLRSWRRHKTEKQIEASQQMRTTRKKYAEHGLDGSKLTGRQYTAIAEALAWHLGTHKDQMWFQRLWVDYNDVMNLLRQLHAMEEYDMVNMWYSQISRYNTDIQADLTKYLTSADLQQIFTTMYGQLDWSDGLIVKPKN